MTWFLSLKHVVLKNASHFLGMQSGISLTSEGKSATSALTHTQTVGEVVIFHQRCEAGG